MSAPTAKSAMVTGAARGIGRAIALRLALDGFAVTVTDLPSAQDAADQVVHDIVQAGGTARCAVVDVAVLSDVEAAAAAHAEAYEGIDVMVANAGVAITAPLLETTPEQWRQTMEVNLAGVFHCYRAAARRMIDQGTGGRLIGAASVSSHRGGKWQGAYAASKFGVRGLTQSVAQELAPHGITANVYSPGVVHTPMWDSIDDAMTRRLGQPTGTAMQAMIEAIPLGRLETPTDVAGVVSFLASPDAAYITGQSIVVDGGMWFS
ncbi:SDR family oxidoreductase [Streptomyces sp. NPDC096311]|uniref:SDR family oxidoreductase n=1 Tax=Streptomyces sp. NPDC096311 TaxID=3366083 RepID=UPI003829F5B7